LLLGVALVFVVPVSAPGFDCGTLAAPQFTDLIPRELAAESSETTIISVQGADLPSDVEDLPTFTHYLARGKQVCDDARGTRRIWVAVLGGGALTISVVLLRAGGPLNRRRA
jgi:hypothetical protein